MGGLSVQNEQEVPILRNKDNSVAYNTNDPLKNKFNQVQLKTIELVNVSLNNAPDENGEMKIKVSPQRTRGNKLKLYPFEIWLKTETDGSGSISSCYAYGSGNAINAYDEARKCDGNPSGGPLSVAAPGSATPDSDGKYQEGDMFTYGDGSGCTGASSFICINGQWTQISRCIPDRR